MEFLCLHLYKMLQPILPDLSNKIKTLAGTSATPEPGGKAFENELEIIKHENKNI